MTPKPPIPMWRWLIWWSVLFLGVVVFYVIFAPIWIAVRVAAWFAELRGSRGLSARRPGSTPGPRRSRA
jgi:hypothetical protein